ncbi:RidA family protein [Metasolibacillus meyeri]|uniref:RidA family protein n=1 Tax=Metasolibacillus meyeri TaxID=1071052 RepID=UPI000D318622|nr:RidA family protein [Metasolibacillus meyeri]
MKKIMRTNPATMPQPVGNYTHITKIPRNAELFVLSGQIGTDIAGHLPKAFNAQVRNTFQNIQSALQAENLNATNIIKVNIWAVEPIDWDYFDEEWDLFFPKEYPAMTIGYISALGLPEIKIEIEIWAANS